MARNKSLSDEAVFAHVLDALANGGGKAASFGLVSQACGLAPATLAQRFGSVEAMQRSAMRSEWRRLGDALAKAEAEALVSAKGVQALLKALPAPAPWLLVASLSDPELAQAAADWRAAVEAAIATRKGGAKGKDAAAILFAAWTGRQMWDGAGGKGFRLSDLMKGLA